MKTLKYFSIYFVLSALNIAFVMADFLPPQPGDPGNVVAVPIDGGILMGLLAGISLLAIMFKKKKKEE